MNGLLSHYCFNSEFFSEKEKIEIFPISKEFEKNYLNIKHDFINYKHPIQPFFNILPDFFIGNKNNEIKENKFWKILPIKTTGTILPTIKYFPSIQKIIHHKSIHNAFFSVLDPQFKIPPHIGPYKGYLRYHLGIIIPQEKDKKPFIIVGNKKYYWKEGEGILFDDMFEHYVENPTNYQRVVLFIDIIRPLKSVINILNHFSIWIIENSVVMKKILKLQHKTHKL